MTNPLSEMSGDQISHLVDALSSLTDGELAVTMLVACGLPAVPYLDQFLLMGPPRTIALPRCRAVHALGELGAYSTLISYFREYERPGDAVVLFSEDAVRSAVARELLRWRSDEVFHVLLDAARQRSASGLILALGEFRREESVPLLFETLGDDLCREEAKDGLRKIQQAARRYAILSIRGLTDTQLHGPSALRHRRATLQLLVDFGVSSEEWQYLADFLLEQDADVVIAAASMGALIAPDHDQPKIVQALFRVSDHLNWAQEDHVIRLLDTHHELACKIAWTIADERRARGERPMWLAPSWRILWHLLGRDLERDHYGAA